MIKPFLQKSAEISRGPAVDDLDFCPSAPSLPHPDLLSAPLPHPPFRSTMAAAEAPADGGSGSFFSSLTSFFLPT